MRSIKILTIIAALALTATTMPAMANDRDLERGTADAMQNRRAERSQNDYKGRVYLKKYQTDRRYSSRKSSSNSRLDLNRFFGNLSRPTYNSNNRDYPIYLQDRDDDDYQYRNNYRETRPTYYGRSSQNRIFDQFEQLGDALRQRLTGNNLQPSDGSVLLGRSEDYFRNNPPQARLPQQPVYNAPPKALSSKTTAPTSKTSKPLTMEDITAKDPAPTKPEPKVEAKVETKIAPKAPSSPVPAFSQQTASADSPDAHCATFNGYWVPDGSHQTCLSRSSALLPRWNGQKITKPN